jgi:signal transduction histidine kinase/HPt (histidine-containing phosphotransfer) domain-containing protein
VNENQIVVSNDWTKNWQAKIAIKTTAIFLWMVISVSFVGIIWLNHNLADGIERGIQRDVEAAAFHVQRALLATPAPRNDADFRTFVEQLQPELEDSYLQALTLEFGEHSIVIGSISDNARVQRLELPFFETIWSKDGDAPLRITAHYPEIQDLVRAQRDGVLLIIALAILGIGIILTWTIQNVLAKPFEVLVDATQQVSRGNLDLRLDVNRDDEFGKLSRFFNQMMDTIKNQQDALSSTNEELMVEIAERKRAEHELKSHRDHLEREVAERTRDLQAARDQALEASKAKSAFIANISHEIRTPLTPIIGFAEALLDEGSVSREQRNSLMTIIRNSHHLLTLINDILDLSKIEADRLMVEKLAVNPFDLLQDIESLVDMQAREKGLDFEIQYEYPMARLISTDPLRLKQILMNLATNAVKFTEKGFVRVTAAYEPASRQFVVQVADSGIGISLEQREQLFQAFSQADSSTTREYGGTGLGLYISQRLARMLGGGIELDSVLGVGSRFVLRVDAGEVLDLDLVHEPTVEPDCSEHRVEEMESASVHGRVLVAEDSPDNQQLISIYLRCLGAEVTLCENGKLAVETALRQPYDLILMDMQMPVMSGLEAVELLRARGYKGPIYALTANAMKEDVAMYHRIGCDGFLAKPIEKASFNRVVRDHLGIRGGNEQDRDEERQYLELVQRFVTGLPDYAREIESGLERNDWESIASLSHQLKGMGGSFGFPELTEVAGRLQRQLRDGSKEQLLVEVQELLDLIRGIAA